MACGWPHSFASSSSVWLRHWPCAWSETTGTWDVLGNGFDTRTVTSTGRCRTDRWPFFRLSFIGPDLFIVIGQRDILRLHYHHQIHVLSSFSSLLSSLAAATPVLGGRIPMGLFFTRISAPSDTILIGEQSNWTSANATDNTASRWVGEFMGGWHDLPSKDKIIIITTTGGLNMIIWLLLVVIDHHRGPLLWSNERYWRFTAYLIVICTWLGLIQFFSHFFFSCLPL